MKIRLKFLTHLLIVREYLDKREKVISVCTIYNSLPIISLAIVIVITAEQSIHFKINFGNIFYIFWKTNYVYVKLFLNFVFL